MHFALIGCYEVKGVYFALIGCYEVKGVSADKEDSYLYR